MSIFTIDHNNINHIDKYYNEPKNKKFENEINLIVDTFWKNTGTIENYFKPLLISHLNLNWLRRFYIYYFALKSLSQEYDEIYVNESMIIIDLLENEFNLKLKHKRKDHSKRFFLKDNLNWFKKKNFMSLKGTLLKILSFIELKKRKKIIYLNAGKLDTDFKTLEASLNAKYVPILNFRENVNKANTIRETIKSNLHNLELSVPNKLIVEFIDKTTLVFLKDVFDYIDSLVKIISEKRIKLAIISTPSHDMHLSLFVAANISKIPCLLVGHGLAATKNPFLNEFYFHNGKSSNYEYKYLKSINYNFYPDWLNE